MTNSRSRLRLPYLDGVRGLAALYVAAYHAFCTSDCSTLGWMHTLPKAVERYLRWLDQGHIAVDIFIVLSGFCLMLPVAASPERQLDGGMRRYMARRGQRILPPYFAAIVLTLIAIAFVPGLGTPANVYWDSALPAFRPDVLLSHLFLVHDLDPFLASKINYPLTTVATEWQIYFFLPLLILPLWRRFGIAVSVLVTVIVSVLPHYLFAGRFDVTCPHFLGLFAMGAAGAVIGLSTESTSIARRIPWGLCTAASWVPLALAMQFKHDVFTSQRLVIDLLIGGATTVLLIHGARRGPADAQAESPLFRFLEARPTMWLGAISYSLYLIHAPVLASIHIVTRGWHLNSSATLAVMMGAGLPLALLAAYGFHLVFEKPFLTRRRSPAAGHTGINSKPKPSTAPLTDTSNPQSVTP